MPAGSRIGISGLLFPAQRRIMERWSPDSPRNSKPQRKLVVVPYDRFGLQRLGGIGQLELDCNPLSQLKFSRQHRGHAAFSEIERTSGNAGRAPGAQHRNIHRNGHRDSGECGGGLRSKPDKGCPEAVIVLARSVW